ncbi:MAG: hypothetical protein CMJ83_18905 [Planctomycetes bacterium]|nr:hypothetical protein [Planctomycetota bacterium]
MTPRTPGRSQDAPSDYGERFEILRELGRGGQGVVYLARDRTLGREVALKVFTTVGADSRRVRARFEREVELASRIDHPGLCRVYEGKWDTSAPYVVMRYVDGELLSRRIERQRREGARADTAGERQALLGLFEAAARALHAAHAAGIVHRDVKPGNIMVTPQGRPVVLDFGMALAEESGLADGSRSAHARGTPAYLSPEQLGDGLQLDRRTDVYALGVSLFEALTGRLPFEERNREALYRAILEHPAPSPRRRDPSLPRDLDAVVRMAMDKDPDRRYGTMLELADDLGRLQREEPVRARRPSWIRGLVRHARQRPAATALALLLSLALPMFGSLIGRIVAEIPEVLAWEEARALERAELTLEQGYEALLDGRYAGARQRFRSAQADGASAVETLGGVVLTLMGERRWQAAIDRLGTQPQLVVERPVLEMFRRTAISRRSGVAVAARAPASKPRPDDTADFLLRAVWNLMEGRPRSARDALRSAVFGHAARPRLLLHALLAVAAARVQDAETGRLLADACGKWPARFLAAYAHGVVLASLEGHEDEAIGVLERAVRLNPKSALAVVELEGVLVRKGRIDDATTILAERAAREPERIEWRIRLARLQMAQGSAKLAVATLSGCSTAEAFLGLARARHRLGRASEATAALREAIGSDPHLVSARAELVRVLVDSDDAEAAAREHAGNLRAHAPPEWRLAYGNALLAVGRVDEAVEALAAASAHPTVRAAAIRTLARIAWSQGDSDTALDRAREAIRESPGDVDGWRLLGRFEYQRNDWRGAVDAWERARLLEPGHARTSSDLGRALQLLGLADEARRAFLEASRLSPRDDYLLRYFANFLLSSGASEELVALCNGILAEDADHFLARFNLARAYQRLRRIPDARAAWAGVLEQASDQPWVHVRYGRFLCATGQMEEGIRECRTAVGMDPLDAPGHAALASVLLLAGRKTDARRVAESALALRPKDPGVLVDVGRVLAQTGRPREAIELLQETVRRHPGQPRSWVTLGRILDSEGRRPEAIAAFRGGLRAAPQDLTAHLRLVRLLEAGDLLEEATATWRTMVALHPDVPLHHTGLGSVLLRRGHDAEAVRILANAVEDFPGDRSLHVTLVRALAQAGNRGALDAERRRWSLRSG